MTKCQNAKNAKNADGSDGGGDRHAYVHETDESSSIICNKAHELQNAEIFMMINRHHMTNCWTIKLREVKELDSYETKRGMGIND